MNVIRFEPNRIHFRGPGSPHDRRDSMAEIIRPFPSGVLWYTGPSAAPVGESLTDYLLSFFPTQDGPGKGIRK